jgi:hypothetical protein
MWWLCRRQRHQTHHVTASSPRMCWPRWKRARRVTHSYAVAERIVNSDTLQLVDVRNALSAAGMAPRVVIRLIAALRAPALKTI